MTKFFLCLLPLIISFELNSLQVGGLTYLNNFKPGETAQVSVTLISDRDKPELVDMKLCDYWCNSEGQHFFEEVGLQPRSNADWVRLSSFREIINPGERREVYFTIQVPKNDQLNGSYWSILLIEPTDPLQTLTESEQGFVLHVKIRYAFHIVTNVGEGNPSLKITKKGVEKIEDKKFFAVNVTNTGDLFLNPKMTIKLFNKQGKLEKTQETQSERLYPGSSSRFLADGEGLPEGNYTAFLLLDNGDGRLFSDTFEINLH
jgi:hypothetical protein